VALEASGDPQRGRRLGYRRRGRAIVQNLYRLPPRVQAIVEAELQQADILGAWIVFAVAGFLGILYLVAPKATDVMYGIAPVPIVAALFLILSLVRLRLAYRGPLSRPAQIVFVLLDFALLYGLIWSFHLQYDQPAAFYLKAPTFLFVFLLIAVRALRFEPAAVLMAGFTAAVGWALMAGYALQATPEPTITRDFIAYMTESLVLVGAEVEKIVAILLVTAVLTLAIVRGRRQLVMAASETTARSDLSRFFAPEVAARITESDELLKPGYGEVRCGSILISDIRDFTAIAARRPANEVMNLLVEYQRRVSRVVTDHGGSIDKYMGDGILATFGCARPSVQPAADALRALMALLDQCQQLAAETRRDGDQPLAFGFAVTSGDVLCGTVGEEERLEFTVIGDAVNRAAKLEKANKTLGTVALVEASLLEAAKREGFAFDGFAPHATFDVDLPGVAQPYLVIGWRPRAS
jgi:adenylate cyclase